MTTRDQDVLKEAVLLSIAHTKHLEALARDRNASAAYLSTLLMRITRFERALRWFDQIKVAA